MAKWAAIKCLKCRAKMREVKMIVDGKPVRRLVCSAGPLCDRVAAKRAKAGIGRAV